MKGLYRVLRLFFCPHHFEASEKFEIHDSKGMTKGLLTIKNCKYCGKIKSHKVMI